MGDRRRYEVIIVGAGIAGASLAYFLSERGLGDVLLLEREQQLAVHSTGRSAATLSQFDTNPTLLELKVGSAPFFHHPPSGFAESPLLRPTGVLTLLGEPAWTMIQGATANLAEKGLGHALLSRAEACERVPPLADGDFAGALFVPSDGRLDVHEILSSYLRHARRRGVELRTGTEVLGVLVDAGACTGVSTRDGDVRARLVVNAAGAWAGAFAKAAGATPLALVPHRRTIVVFPPPSGARIGAWPLVASQPHSVYFAPEAGDILLSPMDEDPMEPCDPSPDEEVVARGLERFARVAPGLVPRTIKRQWSGLRTFAPDRVHVVGEDARLPGFFWLAGQGGCGIETSPLVGRTAAELILEGRAISFAAERLAPSRFA